MIGNLLRAAFLVCFLTGSASAQTLALVGGSVYASPDAALLPDAVILASNGIIIAIGSRSEVSIPSDARVIDCAGKTIVAITHKTALLAEADYVLHLENGRIGEPAFALGGAA